MTRTLIVLLQFVLLVAGSQAQTPVTCATLPCSPTVQWTDPNPPATGVTGYRGYLDTTTTPVFDVAAGSLPAGALAMPFSVSTAGAHSIAVSTLAPGGESLSAPLPFTVVAPTPAPPTPNPPPPTPPVPPTPPTPQMVPLMCPALPCQILLTISTSAPPNLPPGPPPPPVPPPTPPPLPSGVCPSAIPPGNITLADGWQFAFGPVDGYGNALIRMGQSGTELLNVNWAGGDLTGVRMDLIQGVVYVTNKFGEFWSLTRAGVVVKLTAVPSCP